MKLTCVTAVLNAIKSGNRERLIRCVRSVAALKTEGFGIPILDAFSAGCPVLLSCASCFPEIAQDAALYFELDNAEDLRKQLTRLLTDEDLCRSLRAKEAARVKDFSWKKCASETEAVYRKCL